MSDELQACHACDYETVLKEYPGKKEDGPIFLCKICAGTVAGNAYTYQYEHSAIYGLVAHIGNMVLDKIDVVLEAQKKS